jgi:hypothetical protein
MCDLLADQSEELTLVQRAKTFVPTVPMTAMAATMIKPAINAYSITSPPRSSQIKRRINLRMTFSLQTSTPRRERQTPGAAAD